MTETLKAVIAQCALLPDDQQDAIAQWILEYLDEKEWDAIIQSERGQATLARLAAQAQAEIDRGDVEDMGDE